MCGIYGCKNITVSKDIVKSALNHRGPDAFNYASCGDWTFYHARLSILDLSQTGIQPMSFAGNYICFNGEIYNYKELKDEYLSDIELISTSDTEVLLHLLVRYGLSILNKLNGMFAFAFYEVKTGNTYLVRDRYGVKPLYYYKKNDIFCFSSEDTALINTLKIPYVFNEHYKNQLIDYAISDDSENTLINNIYSVKAGYYIKIEKNNISKHQWYFFNDADYTDNNYSSKKFVLNKFEEILTNAISLRLRSDVPVGITLSGGLDSSIIYTLSKENLNAKYNIFTYSNKQKALDEYSTVCHLASDYGDEVIKIDQEDDTMDVFKKSLIHLNGPIWAPSHTGYFNVYKKIKEYGIKVVLEGHGADELLGGWPWTLTEAVKEAISNHHFLLGYKIFKAQSKTWNAALCQSSKNNLLQYLKLIKQSKSKNKHLFSELLEDLFTHRVLPINLRCWDRLSMANSIESRSPFLDYRVVEFLRKLPLQYKCNSLGNKAILREILLKYNKNYIVENKKKQGYLSSEIDFLNANRCKLLTYYKGENYKNDIEMWKNGKLDYSYNTALYRNIGLNILKEYYGSV